MPTPIDNPQRARQLARAIASDLTLYHEGKIHDGIANDNLFDVMRDEIEEGRALFKARVTEDIFKLNIYDRAIVDVLVKSKGHLKTEDLVTSPATGPLEFVVAAEDAGQRLDQFLAGKDVPYSRSQIKRLVDDGQAQVNGLEGKAGRKLKTGDLVIFAPPPPVAAALAPEDIPLRVLWEDEYLIVVDKPAGMVVHPAAGNPSGTLVNALLHHCKDLAGIGGELRPGIVHRLDKDTTGAMVATKDDVTHTAMGALFKRRDLSRVYQAVVSPAPVAESGTIKTMYGRHPVHRKLFTGKIAVGKKAVTHWRVRQRFGGGLAALVECKLETGRTHQIRVHMSEAGWPLAGDKVYGKPPKDARVRALAEELGRQALHAETLTFVHPRTGETIDARAEVPADLRRLLDGLAALV